VVRITGGEWRGRKLEVPDGIRPTTELARKAAFDILGEAIRGARVLDACAGSGAYGLEALSRGAAHATFVESDRKVAEVLRGNVERLGAASRSRLGMMSVGRFSLNGEEGRAARRAGSVSPAGLGGAPPAAGFDVIFHDPPFKEISSESDLQLLLSLVVAGGWLFHERGDDLVLAPGGVSPSDRRRYGLTRFLIYRP
jgi:16S rRNA (guanine966-N2)-methyltransferase